jgi:Ser/Thr protein kinase RdoA (MazF antagonist)
MSEQKFPPGWDEARVKRLIDHYENMSEDELLAEDEAARKSGTNHLPVSTGVSKNNGKVIVKAARPKKKTKKPSVLPRSKGRKGKGTSA